MVARGIRDLAAALAAERFHVTIETAGTRPAEGIACDLASISPKLANSTPAPGTASPGWIARHEAERWQPAVVAGWLARYPFQLKFVVRGEADYAEVRRCLDDLAGAGAEVPPFKVLLMPEGIDAAELKGREAEVIALSRRHGHRFAPRLHIGWFGHRRGT
jgi:7-carboxy-7-deazaguanine synthase